MLTPALSYISWLRTILFFLSPSDLIFSVIVGAGEADGMEQMHSVLGDIDRNVLSTSGFLF